MPLDRVALGTTLRLASSGVETIGLFEGLAEGHITLTDLSACYGAPCPGLASIDLDVVDRADYAAGSQWFKGGLLGLAIRSSKRPAIIADQNAGNCSAALNAA